MARFTREDRREAEEALRILMADEPGVIYTDGYPSQAEWETILPVWDGCDCDECIPS